MVLKQRSGGRMNGRMPNKQHRAPGPALCTGAATARDNRCGMHLQSPVVHVQAEVAHFDADCCISNTAVRIMGSLGNRIPSGRKRFFDKVGWILPAVPLSKREAEDDFKTDRAAFKKFLR